MASVLPIFIVKSFTLQKSTKQSSNCYNSPGEGAIRTRSSANESKNNCRDAIVYARRFVPSVLCLSKYACTNGNTLSKNKMNNSGEAPSPCFTPKLAKNSKKSPVLASKLIPVDYTYILRMIWTSSSGMFRLATNASHNFARFILSYARYRSIKHRLNYLFARMLCWTRVYRMRAYSIVLWCALKPACVGACKLSSSAVVVRRRFMTDINNLERGGATAMLL